MRKQILLVVCYLLASCSNGQLEENTNRYLSIFGIQPSELLPGKGGLMGRVVRKDDGSTAQNAQVYLHGKNTVALTNQKGAFYFPNLAPGKYRVYVIFNDALGISYIETVRKNQVSESQGILEPLVSVSGEVETDELTRGQATVSVEGTPFAAKTDTQGRYALKVPKGKFRISAQHLLYQAYLSEELTASADMEFDIKMKPYEFPTARFSVDSEDGFLVRGRQIRIHIEPTVGVLNMRFVGDSGMCEHFRDVTDFEYNQWQPVVRELSFEMEEDGYCGLTFEFSDAFGKTSKPLNVRFFSTSYDSSWRVLYGLHNDPLVVQKDEKVAFLTSADFLMQHGSKLSVSMDIRGNTLPEANDLISIFTGDVLVQEGATLHGSVHFLGGEVKLQGSQEQPIFWQVGGTPADQGLFFEILDISSKKLEMSYVHLKNVNLASTLYFDKERTYSSTWEMNHMRIENSQLLRSSSHYESSHITSLESSTLDNSIIGTDCSEKNNEEPSERFATGARQLQLAIKDVEFFGSGVLLNCKSFPEYDLTFEFSLSHSNFFRKSEIPSPPEDKIEFFMQQDFTGIGLLTHEDLTYAVGTNYYENPLQLHNDLAKIEDWPEFFGTRVLEKIVGIGAGF